MAELRTARPGDREEIRRIDLATWSPRVTPGPRPDGERDLLDKFGPGAALLDAGIERARREGRRKLTLRVLGENDGARRLYASHGFAVEGTLREAFLLDGAYVDDHLMALDLSR